MKLNSFPLAIGLATAAATASALATDPNSTALEARLKALYPNTEITQVAPSELSGLWEVVLGRNIAYTDATGRYFLFGHLYDMTAQRDLTAERQDSVQRIDFSTLPLEDAIKTVRGNGSRVIAVFSDPDCPYCKRLEPELARVDDVTVYTFLMPLTQLHPNARAKAISVWCAADRVRAWSQLMLKNQVASARTCAHPVDRNVALAERLKINGTPTSIAQDGRVLAGAATTSQIETWLAKPAAAASRPAVEQR